VNTTLFGRKKILQRNEERKNILQSIQEGKKYPVDQVARKKTC